MIAPVAIFSFLKSKWLPLLALLFAVGAGVAYTHQRGYQKGVSVTESRMYKERSEALAAQLVELNRIQEIDLKAAVRAATLEAKVKSHVESIPIPAIPRIKCPPPDGVSDVQPPDPDVVYLEWLHFFNAAVSTPGTLHF